MGACALGTLGDGTRWEQKNSALCLPTGRRRRQASFRPPCPHSARGRCRTQCPARASRQSRRACRRGTRWRRPGVRPGSQTGRGPLQRRRGGSNVQCRQAAVRRVRSSRPAPPPCPRQRQPALRAAPVLHGSMQLEQRSTLRSPCTHARTPPRRPPCCSPAPVVAPASTSRRSCAAVIQAADSSGMAAPAVKQMADTTAACSGFASSSMSARGQGGRCTWGAWGGGLGAAKPARACSAPGFALRCPFATCVPCSQPERGSTLQLVERS